MDDLTAVVISGDRLSACQEGARRLFGPILILEDHSPHDYPRPPDDRIVGYRPLHELDAADADGGFCAARISRERSRRWGCRASSLPVVGRGIAENQLRQNALVWELYDVMTTAASSSPSFHRTSSQAFCLLK